MFSQQDETVRVHQHPALLNPINVSELISQDSEKSVINTFISSVNSERIRLMLLHFLAR